MSTSSPILLLDTWAIVILYCQLQLQKEIVYELKSVGALKIKFEAPMPEQIVCPTISLGPMSDIDEMANHLRPHCRDD